jgi:hypothetical protein
MVARRLPSDASFDTSILRRPNGDLGCRAITAVLHERVLLAARLHLGSTFGTLVTEASGAVDDCFDRRHG